MIVLVNAEEVDSEFVRSLSNDNREFSLNKRYITKSIHKNWFIINKGSIRIIIYNNIRVGMIRKSTDLFISISLLSEYQNKGIGKEVLSKIGGRAIILLKNNVSINVFVRSGFRIKGVYLEK